MIPTDNEKVVANQPIKCKTCENALFDGLWGDYKCKKTGYYVYGDYPNDCEYKEGTPGIAKGKEHGY